MGFYEVASTGDIPEGTMFHFEAKGHEIMVANVGGTFYAVKDRCGHMNAYLSMGVLNGTTVTCPMHFAEFDVTTGKMVSPPKEFSIPNADELPENFTAFLQHAGEIMAPVKTHDLRTYEIKIIDEVICVRV
ncbi:MAG TPA: Rieske 2Fe-2S domain-containing protein [Candidatus Lokiarchaeia archaeon]|nr:Rieske 2Fe-2S domain-containing protein [Candidatus Lokiarchaeia archaeon]